MNTDKKQHRRMPPTLRLSAEKPEIAADGTYSVKLDLRVQGYWPDGWPDHGTVVVTDGRQIQSSSRLDLQDGSARWSHTLLKPGRHYRVGVTVEGRKVEELVK